MCFSTGLAAAADLQTSVFESYSEPVAPAPAWSGFYASLHGGLYMPDDPSATFRIIFDDVTGDFSVDNGYRIGGALGYDFNSNFGTEFEVSYARSDVKSVSLDSLTLPAPGHGSLLTVMANAVAGQDFGRWRLYVGAGAGAAHVSVYNELMSGVDDSDWTWSAQAFAGLDFNITENVSLGARYRYQYIGSTDFADGNGLPIGMDELGVQSVEAVLKVRFGK